MEPRRLLSAALLTGTIIGTPGSYQNDGNTIAKAFDGKLTTYFDGPTNANDFAGLNLGSAKIISQISFAPRSGWASRMVGGLFQGSNSADFSSGVTTLYTVTKAPAQGSLTTIPITNYNAFEFVRYLGPAGSFGNVAEVQFYGSSPTPGPTLEPNGTLVVNGTANPDTITVAVLGDGDIPPDTVITTLNGIENAFPLSGTSQIIVNAGAGADTVSLYGSNDDPTTPITKAFNAITLNGDDGDDQLSNNIQVTNGATQAILMDGGVGNDYLFDDGSDVATLIGGDGNDTFNSFGYPALAESVYGGAGNDTIWAEGNTTYPVLDGGTGVNTIDCQHNGLAATLGFNSILNLNLFVNVHNVVLGNVEATVIGTNGNDTITDPDAFGGDISILGGGGNDTISINDARTIAIDTSGAGGSNITITGGESISITGGDGNDTIKVTDAIADITVNGGDGNDYILLSGSDGDATNNDPESVFVSGGNGNDTIYGYAGDATIDGDAGNDLINYAASDMLDIEGGAGNDTLYGDASTLLINGGDGNDAIRSDDYAFEDGSYISATLNGGTGNDTFSALDGIPTTIDGGDGTDIAYTDPSDVVTNVESHPIRTIPESELTGKIIGTKGSYHNLGHTIASAFDDNPDTYFDGPDPSGDWVGLDLGSAKIVTDIGYNARDGWTNRMLGGQIQASNSANFSTGVVTLLTIDDGTDASVSDNLTNVNAYRYYRYIGPTNGYCDIADLYFYG